MIRTLYCTAMQLLLSFVISWTAHAASFDCQKASTRIENLICTDTELSILDEELSNAYREALAKGINKTSVQQWQKNWLFFTRDACADIACLKTVYASQVSQLREYSQIASTGTAISGMYERYYRGKPDKNTATINVFELQKNRVRVVGTAIWVGNAAQGNVNVGEINGVFPLYENKLLYNESEEDSCHLSITFAKNILVVTDDNSRCGGLNVSFNGEYRRHGTGKK